MKLKNWLDIPNEVYLFKLLSIIIIAIVFGVVLVSTHDVWIASLVTLAVLGIGTFVLVLLSRNLFMDKVIRYSLFLTIGFLIAFWAFGIAIKQADYNIGLIVAVSVYAAAIIAGLYYAGDYSFRKGRKFAGNIVTGIAQACLLFVFLKAIYMYFK